MNVLYDIAVLGLGHRSERSRTGVFRVVENVALQLAQHQRLSLRFCATTAPAACGAYQQAQPMLREVPFRPSPLRVLFDAAQNRLTNARGRAWGVGRVVRGGLYRAISEAARRLPEVDRREWASCELFHSPFHALPEQSSVPAGVRRVLTVYDLIPVHRPDLFESGVEGLRRALASLTPDDWALCISEATRADLLNHRPDLDPHKVRVTHLGAAAHFHPDDAPERWPELRRKYGLPDEPYALTLSTLEPRKNIAQVVRCYARLVAEGQIGEMRLVLVGTRGWKMEAIFEELSRLGNIRDRVTVTGFVPDRDLAPIYSRALMFVYPSLYEGFGLPPLEAMQCGVPVITSNTSSLPEVVGDAGLMVSPTDADALCQAMLTLWRDAELRWTLAARARARAALFSWSRCGAETVAAYRAALGRS